MESTIWFSTDEPYTGFDENRLVVALCTGDLEQHPKYGQEFLGPIRWTEEHAPLLDYWSEHMLDLYGGYVHWLFIEPGHADAKQAEVDLIEWVNEHKEQDRLDAEVVSS